MNEITIKATGDVDVVSASNGSMNVTIPIRIIRRGRRKAVTLPDGTEHAVLHLLYARFWHKVLFDRGHVSCPEPFGRLVNQGMILGEVEFTGYRAAKGGWVSAENRGPDDVAAKVPATSRRERRSSASEAGSPSLIAAAWSSAPVLICSRYPAVWTCRSWATGAGSMPWTKREGRPAARIIASARQNLSIGNGCS